MTQTTIAFHEARIRAEKYPCPYCKAHPGDTCRNMATGQPLANFPAHLCRKPTQPETE